MGRNKKEEKVQLNPYSRELIKYVRNIVNTYASIKECAKDFEVDEDILKDLLGNPLILSYDMYNIISVVLGKSIFELLNLVV